MCHNIGSLEVDKYPKFAQIYIYDTENELNNRLNIFKDLNPDILKRLQLMMHDCSPYIRHYKQFALSCESVPEYKLIIKCDSSIDRRTHNKPTASEVAVIMPGI